MRKISLAVGLMFLLYAFPTHSQAKTPSEFLATIPQPPKSVAEALQRCPGDVDTLALKALVELRQNEMKEQSSIARDSLAIGTPRKLPPVLPKEMSEYRALQQEVDGEKQQLLARLEKLSSKPSQDLLNTIRTIGEELDSEIKNCPKVGASNSWKYDSACVAIAEQKAHCNRKHAANIFLTEINANWKQAVEPLQQSFQSREKRVEQLLASTKNPQLKLQLKRLRLESREFIEPILKTIDEVTRLAAQFTKQ